MTPQRLSIAHSPDADDRFMFWPLKSGLLADPTFSFSFVEADTQSLNRLASAGDYDIIAVSAAHYPKIAEHYQPLRMGASVGAGYGPVLVTLDPALINHHQNSNGNQGDQSPSGTLAPLTPADTSRMLLLSPGHQTTAHNALHALGYRFAAVEVVPITPMELVFERLRAHRQSAMSKDSDVAALLIHEGRLVYESFGARLLLDLGRAWHERWSTNLPLGINVIRRSLPQDTKLRLSALLRESCALAQKHRHDFAKLAASQGSLSAGDIEHYLDLYANDTTADISTGDRQAFDHLLQTMASHGDTTQHTSTSITADWI